MYVFDSINIEVAEVHLHRQTAWHQLVHPHYTTCYCYHQYDIDYHNVYFSPNILNSFGLPHFVRPLAFFCMLSCLS